MQLPKEEYARKIIHTSSSVQIENSVTRVTVRYHSARLVMPNSYPSDGSFNQHLTTIKDSYNHTISRYEVFNMRFRVRCLYNITDVSVISYNMF